MRLSNLALRRAAAAALLIAAAVPARAEPAADPAAATASAGSDLDAIRRAAVAAAAAVQKGERTIATMQHDLGLIQSDVTGRRRGLDESRAEQARLLGNLELLRLNPPDPAVFAAEMPLDRARSEMLVDGIVPALHAEARALAAEFSRIRELDAELAGKKRSLAAAQAAFAAAHAQVADLVAKRLAAMRQMLPDGGSGIGDAETARLAREDGDVGALIEDAEAALARHDKTLLRHRKTDPTRPGGLRAFDPPQSALVPPVSGAIDRPFGADATDGTTAQGLEIRAAPAAVVVAPFDGRVVYAGQFRGLGLVLIMRHADRYHSVLAGLGRADVKSGQWLLAGEPVGAMKASPAVSVVATDAGDGAAGRLYFELRRDGRPVDPQPWLASRDKRSDAPNGEQRVRE